MGMTNIDSDEVANEIVMLLRDEFLADTHYRLESLDACIVSLLKPDDDDTNRLVEFQREVHTL